MILFESFSFSLAHLTTLQFEFSASFSVVVAAALAMLKKFQILVCSLLMCSVDASAKYAIIFSRSCVHFTALAVAFYVCTEKAH